MKIERMLIDCTERVTMQQDEIDILKRAIKKVLDYAQGGVIILDGLRDIMEKYEAQAGEGE